LINTLYYGDNLSVLRKYVRDDSIDLIYLDHLSTAKPTTMFFFGN